MNGKFSGANSAPIPPVAELEERAAIVAEGNGWSQRKAERVVSYFHNCGSWGELIQKSKQNGQKT